MTPLPPLSPNNADPDDRDPIRTLLRSAPIAAVPRDFTLDPAIYGQLINQPANRQNRRRVWRPASGSGVWRGLTAAAAILVVIGATLFVQSTHSGQPETNPITSGRVQSAIAAVPTTVVALPSTARQLGVPSPGASPTHPASLAQGAPFDANMSSGKVPDATSLATLAGIIPPAIQSAQLAPSNGSSANAAGAAAPFNAAVPAQSAPLATSTLKVGGASAADSMADPRATLMILLQNLVLWLRSLLNH